MSFLTVYVLSVLFMLVAFVVDMVLTVRELRGAELGFSTFFDRLRECSLFTNVLVGPDVGERPEEWCSSFAFRMFGVTVVPVANSVFAVAITTAVVVSVLMIAYYKFRDAHPNFGLRPVLLYIYRACHKE